MKYADTDRISELRRKAQMRLGRQTIQLPHDSPDEVVELVHELHTHQIELEIQNEELRSIQLELSESRDRYSDLYDQAPVGYLTVHEDGSIIEANRTLADMLGLGVADLAKERLPDLIHRDDRDLYYLHVRNIIRKGERNSCCLRMRPRNSDEIWAELDSTILDRQDEGTRLRTVVSDVTRRMAAESDARELERQVQHSQKLESLGVLAGGIAHDFNNLLMAILGNADLALSTMPAGTDERECVEDIVTAAKRAAELANEMLAYSGKGTFVIEDIHAGNLVTEMASLLEVSISKKVDFRLAPDERDCHFRGDATQVRQIVMNLITNASEAIGDRSGTITLSSGMMECDTPYLDDVEEIQRAGRSEPLEEGAYAYIEVGDTGCGMDRAGLAKMFDPFYTTKATGRGLGMSAVLGIVHGHRGLLKIDSRVGEGTSIKALFPIVPTRSDESGATTASTQDESDWSGSGTVLIVDDEESVLQVGRKMLEHLGFGVLTASNGHEALDHIRNRADEISCVLLDLTMPGMDGVETFREIQVLEPGMAVILFSGYSEEEAVSTIEGDGPSDFIQKPFDIAVLKHTLLNVLNRSQIP